MGKDGMVVPSLGKGAADHRSNCRAGVLGKRRVAHVAPSFIGLGHVANRPSANSSGAAFFGRLDLTHDDQKPISVSEG